MQQEPGVAMETASASAALRERERERCGRAAEWGGRVNHPIGSDGGNEDKNRRLIDEELRLVFPSPESCSRPTATFPKRKEGA